MCYEVLDTTFQNLNTDINGFNHYLSRFNQKDVFSFHYIGQNFKKSCYYVVSFFLIFFNAAFTDRITVALLLPSISAISRYV